MRRGHGITLGVLVALVIAVTIPRGTHHAPPAPRGTGAQRETPGALTRNSAPDRSAAEPGGRAPQAGERALVGFKSHDALREHFLKHGRDFGAADAFAYLELAQALRDRPLDRGVLELRRADGVITRFDRGSGAFLAFGSDGVIRTFFKPRDGEAYFRRQAEREHR